MPNHSENSGQNGDSAKVWFWDHDLGFALYCLGIPTDEIGTQLGISGRMIRLQAKNDDWEARAEKVNLERALRTGQKASKEQEFIRSRECAYARRLLGMAESEIRQWKPGKATLLDITRLLELASRLGRLGSGLPLMPVELTVEHDISERMQAALDKAYAEEPKTFDVSPAQELPHPSV